MTGSQFPVPPDRRKSAALTGRDPLPRASYTSPSLHCAASPSPPVGSSGLLPRAPPRPVFRQNTLREFTSAGLRAPYQPRPPGEQLLHHALLDLPRLLPASLKSG